MYAFSKNKQHLCSRRHTLNTGRAIVIHRQFESLCEPFGAAIYCLRAVWCSSAKGLFFIICSICYTRTKPAPYCHRRENCTRLISSRPCLISKRPQAISTTSRSTSPKALRIGFTTCSPLHATTYGRFTTNARTPFVCS